MFEGRIESKKKEWMLLSRAVFRNGELQALFGVLNSCFQEVVEIGNGFPTITGRNDDLFLLQNSSGRERYYQPATDPDFWGRDKLIYNHICTF